MGKCDKATLADQIYFHGPEVKIALPSNKLIMLNQAKDKVMRQKHKSNYVIILLNPRCHFVVIHLIS